jgi:hypothetical protein
MKKDRKLLHLNTYGVALQEYAKIHNSKIQVEKTTGELETIDVPIYLCPLCIKNYFFLKDNLIYESAIFSEDHFPPKSVGGRRKILVCKPCNERYGIEIDHAPKEYLSLQAFLLKKENAPYPFTMTYKGVPSHYGINTFWENGNMVQSFSFKRYKPVAKWMLDPNKTERKFGMKFLAPAEAKIQKSILKAAYLYCFYNWGYDFIFSATAQKLRCILNGEEKHPLSNYGVFGDVSITVPDNGFYFISEPKELQAYLVFLDIGLSEVGLKKKCFVVIPGPFIETWDRLSNFSTWVEKREASTILNPLYDNYIQRGNNWSYSLSWEKLSNGSESRNT